MVSYTLSLMINVTKLCSWKITIIWYIKSVIGDSRKNNYYVCPNEVGEMDVFMVNDIKNKYIEVANLNLAESYQLKVCPSFILPNEKIYYDVSNHINA